MVGIKDNLGVANGTILKVLSLLRNSQEFLDYFSVLWYNINIKIKGGFI